MAKRKEYEVEQPDVDAEAVAIAVVSDAFGQLGRSELKRVLDYINARYQPIVNL